MAYLKLSGRDHFFQIDDSSKSIAKVNGTIGPTREALEEDWCRLSVPKLFSLSEVFVSALTRVLLTSVEESVEKAVVVAAVGAVPVVPLVVVPLAREL
ncbi:hypothetical protein HPB47_021774 [Ixodes persulcatus]|uniref:Uncharacterized protein n=1 Tax=Ixodes persulcatus TaxID=34615 RepID=A0AC60QDE8_IXOPE|nr:hypothetical protein HPB47_021774 [Ixodes persulcatus]